MDRVLPRDSPTIISIFNNLAQIHPNRTALKVKLEAKYHDISWAEYARYVKLASLGLIKLGIEHHERVAILSENRPEWGYSDLAIMASGGISVPLYATDTPNDLLYILNDSEARYIFVSNNEQLEKILSIIKKTRLKKVILFEESGNTPDNVISFDELLYMGEELEKNKKDLYETLSSSVRRDDLVTIIYTSGSTGPPKGVMLTHNNFITNCLTCASLVDIGPHDVYLSFLPLSHVFERMAGFYLYLIQGGTIAYAECMDKVINNMKEVSPTIVCGVPRFFEKLYAHILNTVISGSKLKKDIFFYALSIGRKYAQRRTANKKIPLHLAVQKRLFTEPFAKSLKDKLGGSLRFFVSGGAPLACEIANFFLAFDILILEGYGLTETSPVISVNTPAAFKIGTVGRPITGTSVKIASDGEILVKGPGVMKGYFHLYKDTEETIKDQWLCTGDIGHLDKDGFLVITDRKKDIIVTSGGKNISPLGIETLIKADRYIADIMIYGDRRKYLTALVIPDFNNLVKYADYKHIQFRNITELIKNKKIKDFLKRRIDKQQKNLPRYAQVKDFIILDNELTQDRGELTPTLKIKRKIVTDEYKDLLDNLYEEKY